jgi:hypothetical protein
MDGSVKEKVVKLVNDFKTAMTVIHQEDTDVSYNYCDFSCILIRVQ